MWRSTCYIQEKEIGKKVDVYLKNASFSQNTSTQDILDIAEKIENYALDMASSLQENQTVEVKKEELSKLKLQKPWNKEV